MAADANISFSDNPDALLTRTALAEALTVRGFPISAATLASMVTRGGGPPLLAWGAQRFYRWADAWNWAQQRLETPRRRRPRAESAAAAE